MDEILNRVELKAFLGRDIADRTLQRYVDKGLLTVEYRSGPKGSREAIYKKSEVATLKQKLDEAATTGLPAKPTSGQNDSQTTRLADTTTGGLSAIKSTRLPDTQIVRQADKQIGMELIQHMLAALKAYKGKPIVAIGEKLRLTTTEAALLANMSKKVLTTEIKAGKLKAIKDGRGYKIKRTDLEAYVASL